MRIVTTINDALYELGVVDVTEEPTPEDSAFALRTLNRIMDGFNTQNLTIPYLHQIQYDEKTVWNSPTIEITKHTGTDISPFPEDVNAVTYDRIAASPPVDIQQLFFRDQTIEAVDYACTPMTQREWAQIAYKDYKGIPTKYYLQKNSPISTVISFNVIPQDGLRLFVLGKQPYKTDFVPTDDVVWGTGVEKMIMSRLAVELSSSYHLAPQATTIAKAVEIENYVKAFNYSPRTIKSDIGLMKNRGRGKHNPARI